MRAAELPLNERKREGKHNSNQHNRHLDEKTGRWFEYDPSSGRTRWVDEMLDSSAQASSTGHAAMSPGGRHWEAIPSDKSGSPIYYNRATGESRSEPPLIEQDEWTQHLDERTKRPFWRNSRTNESTWENPFVAAAKPSVSKSILKPSSAKVTSAPSRSVKETDSVAPRPVDHPVEDAQRSVKSHALKSGKKSRSSTSMSQKSGSDWIEYFDEVTQRPYWISESTRASTWENPSSSNAVPNKPSEVRVVKKKTVSNSLVWESMTDPATKKTILYNVVTGETRWQREPTADEEAALWEKLLDPVSGRVFYYHKTQGVTQWERPEALGPWTPSSTASPKRESLLKPDPLVVSVRASPPSSSRAKSLASNRSEIPIHGERKSSYENNLASDLRTKEAPFYVKCVQSNVGDGETLSFSVGDFLLVQESSPSSRYWEGTHVRSRAQGKFLPSCVVRATSEETTRAAVNEEASAEAQRRRRAIEAEEAAEIERQRKLVEEEEAELTRRKRSMEARLVEEQQLRKREEEEARRLRLEREELERRRQKVAQEEARLAAEEEREQEERRRRRLRDAENEKQRRKAEEDDKRRREEERSQEEERRRRDQEEEERRRQKEEEERKQRKQEALAHEERKAEQLRRKRDEEGELELRDAQMSVARLARVTLGCAHATSPLQHNTIIQEYLESARNECLSKEMNAIADSMVREVFSIASIAADVLEGLRNQKSAQSFLASAYLRILSPSSLSSILRATMENPMWIQVISRESKVFLCRLDDKAVLSIRDEAPICLRALLRGVGDERAASSSFMGELGIAEERHALWKRLVYAYFSESSDELESDKGGSLVLALSSQDVYTMHHAVDRYLLNASLQPSAAEQLRRTLGPPRSFPEEEEGENPFRLLIRSGLSEEERPATSTTSFHRVRQETHRLDGEIRYLIEADARRSKMEAEAARRAEETRVAQREAEERERRDAYARLLLAQQTEREEQDRKARREEEERRRREAYAEMLLESKREAQTVRLKARDAAPPAAIPPAEAASPKPALPAVQVKRVVARPILGAGTPLPKSNPATAPVGTPSARAPLPAASVAKPSAAPSPSPRAPLPAATRRPSTTQAPPPVAAVTKPKRIPHDSPYAQRNLHKLPGSVSRGTAASASVSASTPAAANQQTPPAERVAGLRRFSPNSAALSPPRAVPKQVGGSTGAEGSSQRRGTWFGTYSLSEAQSLRSAGRTASTRFTSEHLE